MTQNYATPGVYIEEVTGPGVIGGVGTSTAAFIGPATRGPMFPKTITTFDDFKRYYGRESDGWPYVVANQRHYFMAHAVQGFFENGGAVAVILRVGTATPATWRVVNLDGAEVFRLQALTEGASPLVVSVTPDETSGAALELATATATVTTVSTTQPSTIVVTYAQATDPRLVAGDVVKLTAGQNTALNEILSVSESAGTLSLVLRDLAPAGTTSVTLADIGPTQTKFRLNDAANTDIKPGSMIRITDGSPYYAIVERKDRSGFVYLRSPLFQKGDATTAWTGTIRLKTGNQATVTRVEVIDFSVVVSDAQNTVVEQVDGLSLDPFHAGYVFRAPFKKVRVLPPGTAPTTLSIAKSRLANTTSVTAVKTDGTPDDVGSLSSQDYTGALQQLEDVDAVNLVCIPDGANDALIQTAAIGHCLKMRDRIAVLDVPVGLDPDGATSATSHRASVEAEAGFAALYYPWLAVPEPIEPSLPRPLVPLALLVPPSGHVAGVMARIDQEAGVHHAPANTDVRGVMGLERILSDREQGLINLLGVNALRIFPGEGRVLVWGARTTAPTTESDWIYVNVRRLLLYIEESIEKGIRWAVFKPNDYPLWQSLTRTINEFLDRVWRAGGLAGKKREQAYQVRIDEGLNPPAEIALGRLHIEIKVAPVRPAEFIIVRIGLWDGGAEVTEG